MEIIDIARIFFALLAVLGLIGLAAIAARRAGLQNGSLSLHRARRLAIVETLALDQRRRAAIIACDGREHLVILDQSRVTVVERGIPAREASEEADPIAARASVPALRPLHIPAAVARFLKGAVRDEPRAFRAAGIL